MDHLCYSCVIVNAMEINHLKLHICPDQIIWTLLPSSWPLPETSFPIYNPLLNLTALSYKLEGRGFNSRWCHWNFSLT